MDEKKKKLPRNGKKTYGQNWWKILCEQKKKTLNMCVRVCVCACVWKDISSGSSFSFHKRSLPFPPFFFRFSSAFLPLLALSV